jgi:hypothetical protein
MLDKEKNLPYSIQYPETSIQYHVTTSWNHGALSKLDINFRILVYEDIYKGEEDGVYPEEDRR